MPAVVGTLQECIVVDRNGLNPVSVIPDGVSPPEGQLITVPGRDSGYVASRRGRRFYVTEQIPGTVVSGQLAFVDTTPTFMLRNAVGNMTVVILRSISFWQVGVVAGGLIEFAVVLDTTDRLAAPGVSVVPQNANTGSAVPSGISSFETNPTASVVGGTERGIVNGSVPAALGTATNLSFRDGVILDGLGSILVYLWAPGSAPDVSYVFEYEELPS